GTCEYWWATDRDLLPLCYTGRRAAWGMLPTVAMRGAYGSRCRARPRDGRRAHGTPERCEITATRDADRATQRARDAPAGAAAARPRRCATRAAGDERLRDV